MYAFTANIPVLEVICTEQVGLIMLERLREIVSCVKKPELKNWKFPGVKGRMGKVIWRSGEKRIYSLSWGIDLAQKLRMVKNIEADKSEEGRETEEAMGRSNKFQEEYKKPASCSCDVKQYIACSAQMWWSELGHYCAELKFCQVAQPHCLHSSCGSWLLYFHTSTLKI